ncbi:MAG: Hsp20 family protein, partial [Rhizobium sp.]|nr:Hsp20 family protein [Rhizobium sp.]
EAHAHVLTVKGEKAEEDKNEQSEFLYRGIAKRAFERRFQLADHVEVQSASLKNGLLHIELLRNIPEAMKPRRISSSAEAVNAPKAIEARVA